MKTKKHQLILMTCVAIASCALMLLFQPPAAVQAGPTPPPRDTPEPTPAPRDNYSDKADKETTFGGAYIELQVQPNQTGLWTVVQWQDSAGDWHNVEGWQGDLEPAGSRRWWVAAKDFETGPFRWMVAQSPGAPSLGVSAPFNLPNQANEILRIQLSLP